MTTCTECGSDYVQRRSGHLYCCEACRNSAYIKNNPEIVKKVKQKWTDTNKLYISVVSRKTREAHPELYMLRAAKNRANKENIPFNLDVSDITIPDRCPILNIKLVQNSGKPGGKGDSPSLDKIDPILGYVKGNVQVISHLANMMKSSATKEQLKLFADWVQKTYD